MKSTLQIDSQKFWCLASEVGVFPYPQEDGSIHYKYRPASVVFDDATIKEAYGMVITVDHPMEPVDGQNWKDLIIGTVVGHKIQGSSLYFQLSILDEQVRELIANKVFSEVSLGYAAVYDEELGTYEDKGYTHRLVQLTYNHLAIGPANWARLPNAQIILDSLQKENNMENELKEDAATEEPKTEELTLKDLKEMYDELKVLVDSLLPKEEDKEDEPKEEEDEDKKEEEEDSLNKKLDTILSLRELDSKSKFHPSMDERDMLLSFFGSKKMEVDSKSSLDYLRGLLAGSKFAPKTEKVVIVSDRKETVDAVPVGIENLPVWRKA